MDPTDKRRVSRLITHQVVEGTWGLCQRARLAMNDDEATHGRFAKDEWHFAYLVAKRFVEDHAYEEKRTTARGLSEKQLVVTEVVIKRPRFGGLRE
jgi:hypothetical protein